MALPVTDAVSAVDWLGQVVGCRITEIPRRPVTSESSRTADADPGRRQRFAALVSAYHGALGRPATERPLLVGWCRSRGEGPIDLLAAGPVMRAADTVGSVLLSLPSGARGVSLAPTELGGRLNAFPHWTRISGITDGLLVDDPAPRPDELRPSLEDGLLRVWREPFAWFVLAEPLPRTELGDLASEAARRQRDAQKQTSSPDHQVIAVRAERRHRELREAESAGMWRIHLLAGGLSDDAARSVAGLVAASADLDRLPYALVPAGRVGDLADVLHESVGDDARSPFVGSSLLLSALTGAPKEEIPGVRLALRPEFDVTPETVGRAGGGGEALDLGVTLDRNSVATDRLSIPRDSLNRHTFVCGSTGGGKSQTVRRLLEEATAGGVPWLVVEPAKAEYHLMADRVAPAEVIRIRPGDPDSPPAGLNPLEPAPGFPLQTHIDFVRALFLAAFEAEEPFPQVVSAALSRCYEDLGWDLALSKPRFGHQPRWPTLADLERAAETVVDQIGYSKEITDNVRGFIRVRLGSLRFGTPGRFFEGGHPIDFAALMRRNVVFEIEDVGDDRDKAFLMGSVLVRLTEYLRMEKRSGQLPENRLLHLTVFEEAHRLLRRSEQPGPSSHAVELFASLLAEIRAYGEGLVIAEQIPSKLVPDVIKNTAVKIVHRLPAKDDREAVGATMNLTDAQSQYLVTLPPGTGVVFADGMDFPVLGRIRGSDREGTGVAGPTGPTSVIGPRSPACRTDCTAAPCSMRTLQNARQLLSDVPGLTVWAELAMVAHLAGMPEVVPSTQLLDSIRRHDRWLYECAAGLAADDAVSARVPALHRGTDAQALAVHLATEIRAQLDGSTERCAARPWEWSAATYRWLPIQLALLDLVEDSPDAARHPAGDDWEAGYGIALPGERAADQLAFVDRLSAEAWRDTARAQVAGFGAGQPSAIEAAVGRVRQDPDWDEALAKATADFTLTRNWTPVLLGGTAEAAPLGGTAEAADHGG